jgi:hypothetical protein
MFEKLRGVLRVGFIFLCVILLSGFVYAEESVPIITLNQGTVQDGRVTVNGTFSGSLEGRQLILAVYDTEGKMTELTSVTSVDGSGNWNKELNSTSLISGLKAFLLDTSVKPVIDAQGLHRSAMVLKIASAGTYSGYYEEVQVLPSVTGQVIFEDMQVRGDLTIAAAQKVIFKGNSMVTGSLKLQKLTGSPTEVILLGNSRVNMLENTGASGAIFMSLTETQTTLLSVLTKENLQLINTSAGTVTLEAGLAQNLKLGLSLGAIERCEVNAQTGVTPSGVTLSVQVEGFINPLTRIQTEIEAQNLEIGEYWQGEGESIQNLSSTLPITALSVSQWGDIITSAQFTADASAVIQSLTSSANVEVRGELVFGKGVQLTGKDAPDFSLLGSGTSSLTGNIGVLTLGGSVTGILTDDDGKAYSVGSVILQAEATFDPSSFNLLAFPGSGPSFTSMPGGLFGLFQTMGSGNLGNIIFMHGPSAPPPVTFGNGLLIGSLQFGNNSFGTIQFGSDSQLGSLLNQSPFQSILNFPSGTNWSQVIQNFADTNSGSRIRVKIGDGEDEGIDSTASIVPISMKSVTNPSKFSWIGQSSEEFLRNMTVELQYSMMNIQTGETSEPMTRKVSVRGNEEFSISPSGFILTGSQEVEIKHIPTGMTLKLPVKVYANQYSVVQMSLEVPPYVIRDPATGNGKLAGGEVRGITVSGKSFNLPIYNGDGLKLGEVECSPSIFNSRISGSVKITAMYNGASASAYIDIGSATTWGYGFKQTMLDELDGWEARLNEYIDPERTELSRIIDASQTVVISATSEQVIITAMDAFRARADKLMKTDQRLYYNLLVLQETVRGQIWDYWPEKAVGVNYVAADYSVTGTEKIYAVKAYWISAVESAETELQINGTIENPGMVARAKAEIDAIPRKGDDLNAVLNRFGESPSKILTRSAGTSDEKQTALLRDVLYREMLLLGGEANWKVSCVRNSETNYTVTLISAESAISAEKVFNIQWNVWETRGSVVSELYLALNQAYPSWAASKPHAELYSQFADHVNMTDSEKIAFAFFFDQGFLNGMAQIGGYVTMAPDAWITRNQYLLLLNQIEEKLLLNLPEATLPELYNTDELLASGTDDFVKQTNQIFVTAISTRLKLVGDYTSLPPQLNDPNVQTILTQGQIDLTAGEDSYKNIIVLKNAHLTINTGFQLAMKDQAILLLLGSLTNNGELHIDPDAQFEMRVGAMLNNTARFVNFGRAMINGVMNPNLYNIEHHSVANRVDIVLGLYQRFHEGYGFLTPTTADLELYASRYSDWNQIQSDDPEDIREEAMAWLILNGGYAGYALPENALSIHPWSRLNRAETAMMLYQFAQTFTSPLTLVTNPATFSDVVVTDEYYTAVTELAKIGVLVGDGEGLFRASYIIETTWFNWGNELDSLLNRLVAAAGYAESEISLIRIMPGENPVFRNKNFVNPVSVYTIDHVDFTDNWGGEVRFINCKFSDYLKINLVDINYMVVFENVVLCNDELYTTTPDPEQMVNWGYVANEMMPDPYNRELRVSINGVASGTHIYAGVNTEVTMTEVGTFFLNGAQIHSTDVLSEGHGVSAVVWNECEAQHPQDYNGDHSECVKDPNASPTVAADQYQVLEVRDQVAQLSLPIPSIELRGINFGRVVMNDDQSPADIDLNFGTYTSDPDFFRINGGRVKTLILNGTLTGNLEVVGKADLRNLTVSGSIFIGTWWEQTSVNIGNKAVGIIGYSDKPIALTADNGAHIQLMQAGQQVQINRISENDIGFDIGQPHVYGDQGSCGVYVGTASLDYTFKLFQGNWNESTKKMDYTEVTVTSQVFQGDDYKTHLEPVNQAHVTDKHQLFLQTTWTNGDKTILVDLVQIPIKVVNLNLASYAMWLFTEFKDSYGLTTPSNEELNTFGTRIVGWAELNNDEQRGMGFLIKNGIFQGVPDESILPRELTSRSDAAFLLYRLALQMQNIGSFPNGLNLTIQPNPQLGDIPGGEVGIAILNLAKAGVIPQDPSGFRPSEWLSEADLRDWMNRLKDNLGPVTTSENAFEVMKGQELRIENKIFSQEVKVFCNQSYNLAYESWSDENQGGQIWFINCDFQGGLTLQLGDVGYLVSFENTQLKDQLLNVSRHDTKTPNPYLGGVQVNVNGVPSGTSINSSVNVNISNNQVGYFVLNGIQVDSAALMPQFAWYRARIMKQCNTHHEPNYVGDHSLCKENPWDPNSGPAKQFNMIEFNGQVATVTPLLDQATKYNEIARYQVREITTGEPVELNLTGLNPIVGRLYLQAETGSYWNVTGSAACDTEVTGSADLTEFQCQGNLLLNNWYPEENTTPSHVSLTDQSVILQGDNRKYINITAGNGAHISSNMGNFNMSLTSSTNQYALSNPHLFGEGWGLGVYLDSALAENSGYIITLEKSIWSEEEQQEIWLNIPYRWEVIPEDYKTHLFPLDPFSIDDPFRVRMTVEWTSGTVPDMETITIIYDPLPYQQPIIQTADAARVIFQTYVDNQVDPITSDYGLMIPTETDLVDYAIWYEDWSTMSSDYDLGQAMAILARNQILQSIQFTDEDTGLQYAIPFEQLNRGQLVKLLYALVQTFEQQLGVVLPETNPEGQYEDVPQDHTLYTEISYLLQREILPTDWMRFEPDMGATKGDLEYWNFRIQGAFGPVNSSITEIVLNGSDRIISNKIFDQPVTIRNAMARNLNEPLSNYDENWGGRLEIMGCVFQQGLNVELDQVPYEISMGGSEVVGEIHVFGSSNGNFYDRFDSDWNVGIHGVANGTKIVNDINVSVTSNEPNDSFNLNGNLVVGADNLGQNGYFGANLQWICNDFETHGETNDHSNCEVSLQHHMLGVHGAVKEIQAGVEIPQTVQSVQRFELWDVTNTVDLKFPTDTNAAYTSGNSEILVSSWSNPVQIFRVSGLVGNTTYVEGTIDIQALQVTEPYEIGIFTWRDSANVVVGANMVSLYGPQGRSFALQVAPQAKIHMWFVGAVPVDLKDMTGTPILYDVSMVNWVVSPDDENVILIGSGDSSLNYVLYEDDVAIAFEKFLVTKKGETEPSLTGLVPVVPILEFTKVYVVEIQKSGVSFFYTPLADSGELQVVNTFEELLVAAEEESDQGILLAQSISLPVAPVDGWSLELNRLLVIDENATLTVPAGAKMAYKSIDNKGNIVVEGYQEPIGEGYLQGGNISGGIRVGGEGSISISVDEVGLREALQFSVASDISIDQPLALSGTLSLMRTEQQPPRRIFLFSPITALQDNTAFILYQGDLLKNEITSGHNFYETDNITPIPDEYFVTDQMRVFKWKVSSARWIADFDEGTGLPPMPT